MRLLRSGRLSRADSAGRQAGPPGPLRADQASRMRRTSWRFCSSPKSLLMDSSTNSAGLYSRGATAPTSSLK